MELTAFEKIYCLDVTNHRELFWDASAERPSEAVVAPIGTAYCRLLNLPAPELLRLRARLGKLLTSSDPDACLVMLGIRLGQTALPDSEYAAMLFGILDEIADLDPLLYIETHVARLFSMLEAEAPEKEIIKQLAVSGARAVGALDLLTTGMPRLVERVDAVVNYTALERSGGIRMPVLQRALAYQRSTTDPTLPLRDAAPRRLLIESAHGVVSLDPENYQDEPVFYGVMLEELSLKGAIQELFRQMIWEDTVVRACGVCGRYFVPLVRSNEKYCDHLEEDEAGKLLTCKQRSTKTRLESDQSLKLLKSAYDKNFIKATRKKSETYKNDIFKPWYAWAKEQRQLCVDGKISPEELAECLRRKMDGDYRLEAVPAPVLDAAVAEEPDIQETPAPEELEAVPAEEASQEAVALEEPAAEEWAPAEPDTAEAEPAVTDEEQLAGPQMECVSNDDAIEQTNILDVVEDLAETVADLPGEQAEPTDGEALSENVVNEEGESNDNVLDLFKTLDASALPPQTAAAVVPADPSPVLVDAAPETPEETLSDTAADAQNEQPEQQQDTPTFGSMLTQQAGILEEAIPEAIPEAPPEKRRFPFWPLK